MVCLDTAQEILRKHEKTTYSWGLSPVTAAHKPISYRGQGSLKRQTRELCRCYRFESKTGCFWLFTSSFCLWQPPTNIPIYRKKKQFPSFFSISITTSPEKKSDVITLRSFWTSHLALRGPRGLRGLRPAHLKKQAPPGSGRVQTCSNWDIGIFYHLVMSK